jgi:hypothetical protein
MSSIYYAAAWTECGCQINCSHQHRTVGDAAPCIRRAGGYVVAVDAGALRSLTPEEEADFRCASQPCTDTPIVQITSAVADGQTIGESGYAVMTRIRVENHLKWTTWMCFETYAEAEAHRREGNTVVQFGSSEWSALLQNCEAVLPTTTSAERKSRPHRGNAETLVEFVLRFLS